MFKREASCEKGFRAKRTDCEFVYNFHFALRYNLHEVVYILPSNCGSSHDCTIYKIIQITSANNQLLM